MRTLTTKEILKLTGLPGPTVQRWVDVGVVAPTVHGTVVAGNGHRFSLGQAFALYVAAAYREERSGHDRVTGILRYLSAEPLERLEAYFAEGKTFPVPAALAHRAAREEGMAADIWLPGMMVRVDPQDPSLTPSVRALMKRLSLPDLLAAFRRKVAKLNLRPRCKRVVK